MDTRRETRFQPFLHLALGAVACVLGSTASPISAQGAGCRAAVETLAAIKNPPVVFARQANIAQGPQQVNNQMMPTSEPRARGENENTPNKLSGGSNELLPDPRTPGAAVGSDPAMATVGTFDGAEVRRG
jgi:hypothetical protein